MVLSGYDALLRADRRLAGLTPLIVLLGWRIFSRLETTMADEI